MSYDYSENILVQESAGHLLEDELGWHVELAYNTEVLGETGTFGRKSYKEILLVKYLKQALSKLKLIFGVSNDSELVGLADAEGDAEKISEAIKIHLNPIPEFRLSFEKDEDKTFVIVEVMKEWC